MKTLIGAALIAAFTAATPALANHDRRDTGINARQRELEHRIDRGWRAGDLTPREYRRLVREAREIERAEHFFRADGWLSPHERSDLHARLDRLARDIH